MQVAQVVVVRASNGVADCMQYHIVHVGYMEYGYPLGSSRGDLLMASIQQVTGIDRQRMVSHRHGDMYMCIVGQRITGRALGAVGPKRRV